jgi:hypothetical protein
MGYFGDDFFSVRATVSIVLGNKASHERILSMHEHTRMLFHTFSSIPHTHSRDLISSDIATAKEMERWEAMKRSKKYAEAHNLNILHIPKKAQILNNGFFVTEKQTPQEKKQRHELEKHGAVKIFSKDHKFYCPNTTKFPKINEEKTTTGECETVAGVLRSWVFLGKS